MTASRIVAWLENRIGADPIVVGIVAFFVAHLLIRLFGTSNFSVDETMTAIHTQRFQLFYLLRNPPLFDWLYFGMGRLFGTGLFTMQILKTLLLAGGALFLYLAIKPAFRHRIALVGAIASLGATAFYGWEIFQLYSHTNALIFAMGFSFWAFMRTVRSRHTIDYLLLGVGLALGILSKYLFGAFILALLVAALRSSTYRPAVLSWRILLTLATGLLLLSPLLYGLSGSIAKAFFAVGERVAAPGSDRDLASLAYFLAVSAEFWLPFAAILWVCLARWPADSGVERPAHPDNAAWRPDESFYPFARDATLLLVAVTMAGVLLLGTRITAGHYLAPVLSLLPVAIFAGLDRRQPFPGLALANFQRGAVAFIIGVAVVRFLLFLFASPPFCVPRCILFVDYRPVVERLASSDGMQNVILSNDIHIASNLLVLLPNARVIVPTEKGGLDVGIAGPAERKCYFIWFQKYRNNEEQPLESALRRALRRPPLETELSAVGAPEYIKAEWQTKLLWDWGPDTIIGLAPIDSSSPLCASRQPPGAPAT